jgi:hypothetical protein
LVHSQRHRPEQRTLPPLVKQYAACFLVHTEASAGAELIRFTEDDFHAVLECRIVAHSFLRFRRGECGHDKLLAFSCRLIFLCPASTILSCQRQLS